MIGRLALREKYNIASNSILARWINQYRETGSTYDNRGKGSTKSKKKVKLSPEEMTREELIEYVKAVEDIKKSLYLNFEFVSDNNHC